MNSYFRLPILLRGVPFVLAPCYREDLTPTAGGLPACGCSWLVVAGYPLLPVYPPLRSHRPFPRNFTRRRWRFFFSLWLLAVPGYKQALFRSALRHTVRGRFAVAFAKLCLILRTVLCSSLRKIQCFATERACLPRYARPPATLKSPLWLSPRPLRGRSNPQEEYNFPPSITVVAQKNK